MPSLKNTTPLLGGRFYHLYNRGNNQENIFFEKRNYEYFLSLWNKYLVANIEILAYCLLPNHFHLLIKIPENIKASLGVDSVENEFHEEEIGNYVSEQFRRLFISYSQAINKQQNRSGNLFNRNFKRILLESDEHLKYLFFYIHYNSEKHKIIENYRQYRYSSYQAYLSSSPTSLAKKLGLELFDGLDNFLDFHEHFHQEKEDLILE